MMLHLPSISVTRKICLFALLAAAQLNAEGQGPPEQGKIRPELVVVSVRASNPKGGLSYRWTESGLVESGNSLFWLIQTAYGLPEQRFLEGSPAWTRNEKFDVVAKLDEADREAFSALPAADRGKLLQKVLIERFGLTSHWESRVFPEYALTVLNPGQASRTLLPSSSEDIAKPQWKISIRPYNLDARGATVEQLCQNVLSTEARQLVVDQTGLVGKYNFQLRWSRVDINGSAPASLETDAAPDIFSAVQEQLGLKMIQTRVPVQVLVVDEIHRPTEN
jgi:uncharacterized protein (TIGR03435 family)